MPAGIGYGLKKIFSPSYAGRQAYTAAARGVMRNAEGGKGIGAQRRKAQSSHYSSFRETGRVNRQRTLATAKSQGQDAYNAAYRRQKNINIGVGIGAGAMLYPNTGQTGPNQNTFARRGMQNRRTVGISSGAMQSIQRGSSMYGSIGGM